MATPDENADDDRPRRPARENDGDAAGARPPRPGGGFGADRSVEGRGRTQGGGRARSGSRRGDEGTRGGRRAREEPQRRGEGAGGADGRRRDGSRGASAGGTTGSRRAPRPEAGAPERPYRPARRPPPRRPELPGDRPIVPRDAWRDLRATVPPNVLDDVVRAVGAATEALEAGDDARAMELLAWAKSAAPRSATIRETLGIAHYAAERYAEAHSELLAYRRLSGAQDQNHVLADCARAAGRHDKVREYVDQMIQARVDDDRIAEGLMVLAGARADRDDLEGALDTLERAGLGAVQVQPYHPRLWYLAGDLCQRLGRDAQAREYFEAILAVDEEFGDVDERLAALED